MTRLLLVLIFFTFKKSACGAKDNSVDYHGPHPESIHPDPPEQTETPGAFQSDMMLTDDQAEEITYSFLFGDVHPRRAVRTSRWPQAIIPYEIDGNFGEGMRTKIREAMDWWREDTCITFEEYTPSGNPDSDHRVRFRKVASGCCSDVGMINHFPQYISLEENSCDLTGTIAHEIGHTVGWWHEHSRIDRNEYVTLRPENIQDGEEKQFVQHDSETFGIPYDVESIMHYASTYFSKNGKLTIEPKYPLDMFKMGNRKFFTFYDKKFANVMYNCSQNCEDLQCENEGYVGKDCVCHCKPGYSGQHCEVDNGDSVDDGGCIRELEADINIDKVFTSPGYPKGYGPNLFCTWLITGPEGTTVSLSFLVFDTEASHCQNDYVKIREGPDIYNGGDRYCGHTPPETIQSVGNRIMVMFMSDGIISKKGFLAQYRADNVSVPPTTTQPPLPTTLPAETTQASTTTLPAETTRASTTTMPSETTQASTTTEIIIPKCQTVEGTCGGTFKKDSGCIASPNFGHGEYNNDEECVYYIQVKAGKRVELRVEQLDVEHQATCTWDKVEIIPGPTLGSVRMCGESPPEGTIVSLDNTMTVKMISDALVAGGGFAASFEAITVV
ncbi:protein SpAN-like [Acanthaster planci]|uniref:Metalloendopeptidase n=1 Tax=Acanthaster planci TaxID=133434 RepID=A0A8B7Y2K4_ACAPL|nr:protein SpAN-like [Acanthaster planci]